MIRIVFPTGLIFKARSVRLNSIETPALISQGLSYYFLSVIAQALVTVVVIITANPVLFTKTVSIAQLTNCRPHRHHCGSQATAV